MDFTYVCNIIGGIIKKNYLGRTALIQSKNCKGETKSDYITTYYFSSFL